MRRSHHWGAPGKCLVIILGVLLLSACAGRAPLQYQSALQASSAYQSPVELTETPFYPQEAYQCGPAALATVLQVSGVAEADPDILADQVYLPERRGSLQMELLGATRRADRIPYIIEPQFEALLAELHAGNPVLVLQNLGLERWPVWHYAVVIGVDPSNENIILRSGTTEREITGFQRFERSWQMAGYWGIVVTEPGSIPASASPLRYFEAVAPLEQQQRYIAAQQAYKAAADRWPEDATSYIGLGNIAYQQQQFSNAESFYYQATELAPDYAPLYFNLAWALLRQGKTESALKAAQHSQNLAPDDPRFANAVSRIQSALAEQT